MSKNVKIYCVLNFFLYNSISFLREFWFLGVSGVGINFRPLLSRVIIGSVSSSSLDRLAIEGLRVAM